MAETVGGGAVRRGVAGRRQGVGVVVAVGDVELYYEARGAPDAEPLVVICGLAMDVSEIEPLLDGLARRFRVLALDNRGAGRSDKPDSPYTLAMMATDTAGVMRAAGIARARVLGMSMGGRIALSLALAEPAMVSHLVLVSTGARVVRSWRRRLLTLATRLPVGRGSYPQPRYAFDRQLAASGGTDLTPRLGEVRAPALVLHGRDDRIAPLDVAKELVAGIPDATLHTFPGGHMFMLVGQRDQFLAVVLDTLR